MTAKTAGVPNPTTPGHWLVPPWSENAAFNQVVRHFLRFHPWWSTDPGILLAYFEGYQAALSSARTNELILPFQQGWAEELRDCVDRCVLLYREQHQAERPRVQTGQERHDRC